MSKTQLLRELVHRHAPKEVNNKLKAIDTLEKRISELKGERHCAFKDLLTPQTTEEPCMAIVERNGNGHAVPF